MPKAKVIKTYVDMYTKEIIEKGIDKDNIIEVSDARLDKLLKDGMVEKVKPVKINKEPIKNAQQRLIFMPATTLN